MFRDWIHMKSQIIDMQIETDSDLIDDINLCRTKAVLGPVLTSDWGLYNTEFDFFFSLQCLKVSPLNLHMTCLVGMQNSGSLIAQPSAFVSSSRKNLPRKLRQDPSRASLGRT